MSETLNVSLRECRLVAGRLLRALGVPRGAVPAARDAFVTAQALGLDGLRVLRDDAEVVRATATAVCRRTVEDGRAEVDGRGRHALVAAPDLLDLAVALTRRHGAARLHIRNIHRPRLLSVLVAEGAAYGVELAVDPETATVTCRPAGPCTGEKPGPVARVLHEGADIDPEVWWELYHRSQDALTPDSAFSRHHTGRSVLTDDGRIVGEIGEDFEPQPATSAPGTIEGN
ncbi:hypothetical protein ACIREO_01720 [Streptomyces sp. NPDC102441]|uniref:hypothetical protein n=1 Tax=Streptomyces sp. NPDC102441 TaxID=3366176 RepID=UPI0038124DB2